jgi:branched-chain amino acid transport system permease protein
MTQTAAPGAEVPARTGLSPVEKRELAERILLYAIVAALIIWLATRLFSSPQTWFTTTLNGLNNGALYALIALGYTMVYGIIELINFSHGDLFMLSSVASGLILVNAFGAEDWKLGTFVLMILTLLLVMAMAAGVNTAAERVAYRRLRRAPKLAPLITAVGLSFSYQWAGIRLNGSGPRNWPRLLGDDGFSVGGVEVRWTTVIVIGVTVPLLLLMTYIVQSTRQGKAMRATAQDQDAARLMGINVDRTIAFTFALGGALAGAAGLLWLESVGNTRYDAGFQLGLIAFTAAVLGGIGNLRGAVLGGVLIGLIQSYNTTFALGQKWDQTVVFSILIFLMVFKPEGLLGKRTTEKV